MTPRSACKPCWAEWCCLSIKQTVILPSIFLFLWTILNSCKLISRGVRGPRVSRRIEVVPIRCYKSMGRILLLKSRQRQGFSLREGRKDNGAKENYTMTALNAVLVVNTMMLSYFILFTSLCIYGSQGPTQSTTLVVLDNVCFSPPWTQVLESSNSQSGLRRKKEYSHLTKKNMDSQLMTDAETQCSSPEVDKSPQDLCSSSLRVRQRQSYSLFQTYRRATHKYGGSLSAACWGNGNRVRDTENWVLEFDNQRRVL